MMENCFCIFLEQCKYVVNEKKIPKYIIDDIEIFSDSNSDEEILIKKIQMEKNYDVEILKKVQTKKNSDEENYY